LSAIPAVRKYTVIRDPKLRTVRYKKEYAIMVPAQPLDRNSERKYEDERFSSDATLLLVVSATTAVVVELVALLFSLCWFLFARRGQAL
jgi:hypothetical protein